MKKPGAAAATTELGRQHSGERKKKMEATSGTRLMGRATYKVKLISGCEKRGGHGVVISPSRRLDFRDGSKDKIRCGYSGVKNGLNGR